MDSVLLKEIRKLVRKSESYVVFRNKEANTKTHCVSSFTLEGIGRHTWKNDTLIG